MKSKFKLPVLVERSIGQVQTTRKTLGAQFESAVVTEAHHAGVAVTCSAGCSSCCYHPISISVFEGIPIYRHLVRSRKWTADLRKKLHETAIQQMAISYEVWLLSLIPCALLDNNKLCMAYDERPLTCQTMVSVGDPYFCHPHHIGEQTEVLPREGILSKFETEEAQVLRKNRLQVTKMPLGQALLFAERLCTGTIDLDAIDGEIIKEFAKHG